jgi:hypothetical protein
MVWTATIRRSHMCSLGSADDTEPRSKTDQEGVGRNKLALNAGWDEDLLSLELEGLREEGFNIDLTGFTSAEIADLNDVDQNVDDPFSKQLLREYNKRFRVKEQFTGGSACSGLYRGMMLWAAAVKEAGTLDQDKVIAALDHAKIAEGPGGPAEIVPGQHHVRMNMYIAQVKNGRFEIVEELGAIDPQEAVVPSDATIGEKGAAS